MSIEEIKKLEKEVSKLKFKATQMANEVHDLVEDRLFANFEDLPIYASQTYELCLVWLNKQEELNNAKQAIA